MNGRFVKAGTVGERGRKHLERAVELEPERIDALYSNGLYYFYASLVPDFVKWLTFLWFVPTGDADKGIDYIDQVRRKGRWHRDDAALVLMNIQTYHRDDYALARRLGESLLAEYPTNTVIQFELLEVAMAQGDYERVLAEAPALENAAFTRPRDRGRAAMARVWRARAELMLGRSDASWETLADFAPGEPASPSWGARWVSLTRGQIRDAQGRRKEAERLYQEVIDEGLSPLWSRTTELALAYRKQPFRLPPMTASASE